MRALLIVGLAGCWTGSTQPTLPASQSPEPVVEVQPGETSIEAPPEAPTPSYRATTMAVDSVGIVAMAAGFALIGRNDRSDAGHGLAASGMLLTAFGAPIVHLAHGKKGRAGGSYLLRSLSSTVGMFVGIGITNCPREGSFTQLGCMFEGMLWGTAGGLVVGSALDALFLHGQPSGEKRWIPTVTPDRGGATVGIAGGF